MPNTKSKAPNTVKLVEVSVADTVIVTLIAIAYLMMHHTKLQRFLFLCLLFPITQ
jgi:hypothetical protein